MPVAQLTAPLSAEAAHAVPKAFPTPRGDGKWHGIVLYGAIVNLVNRLTARVVMVRDNSPEMHALSPNRKRQGEALCRDESWLSISRTYTAVGYNAVRALRLCPPLVRPFMHRVLPATRALRRQYATCAKLIEDHQRKLRGSGSQEAGSEKLDYIHWAEAESATTGRPYDLVRGQLGFVVAVMHTTSALLTNIMFDLCARPEYITPLRQEFHRVTGGSGVLDAKTQLHQLKLMDSFMKESQRLAGGNYCKLAQTKHCGRP